MRNDVTCPYCDEEIEINHDDGNGYEEDVTHQQECSNCHKTFVFTTSIHFSYEAEKADCLNGSDHVYESTHTIPRTCTRMRCTMCDDEGEPTKEEWKSILTKEEIQEHISKYPESRIAKIFETL
jgi:hypothetical protein